MYTCVYISNVLLAIYLPAFFIHIDTFSHKWDHIPYFQLHYLVILQLYGFSYLIKKTPKPQVSKSRFFKCKWRMLLAYAFPVHSSEPMGCSPVRIREFQSVTRCMVITARCSLWLRTSHFAVHRGQDGFTGFDTIVSNLEPGLDNVRIENIWV